MELDCLNCSDEQKRDKGCFEDSPIPERWQVEDYYFQRCPLKVITKQSREFLNAYRLFKLGYLPDSGSWRKQSYKYTEAMLLIDTEISKINKPEKANK
jgi:hypothetical protein